MKHAQALLARREALARTKQTEAPESLSEADVRRIALEEVQRWLRARLEGMLRPRKGRGGCG
jgi:hypothetical protein